MGEAVAYTLKPRCAQIWAAMMPTEEEAPQIRIAGLDGGEKKEEGIVQDVEGEMRPRAWRPQKTVWTARGRAAACHWFRKSDEWSCSKASLNEVFRNLQL